MNAFFKNLLLSLITVSIVSFSYENSRREAGYIINTNPLDFKRFFNTQIETQKTVKLFKNIYIAEFPKFKSLKSISDIQIHPLFTTVIIFPYKIKKAQASFKPVYFETYKNLLYIRPPFQFTGGSINVLLQKNNGTEMVVSIIATLANPYKDYPPFFQKKVRSVEIKPILYYPQIVFVDREILSPEEVLRKYIEINKKLPEEDTFFFIDGVGYKIYVNPKFPNIRIDSKSFRVEVERIKS